MTDRQFDAIKSVADKYGTHPRGVALMASVMGPIGYRGCVLGLIEYRPSRDEQRQVQKRQRKDTDFALI